VHFQKKKEKKKTFKLYPEGYPVEWWMIHLFFCESPSLQHEDGHIALGEMK
jgi:hypothetical protein